MSLQRRCDIWLATDKAFYMLLGDHEYAEDSCDCTAYGPFVSEEKAWGELEFHSNPGGGSVDRSGTRPPPENPKPPTGSPPQTYGNHPGFTYHQKW